MDVRVCTDTHMESMHFSHLNKQKNLWKHTHTHTPTHTHKHTHKHTHTRTQTHTHTSTQTHTQAQTHTHTRTDTHTHIHSLTVHIECVFGHILLVALVVGDAGAEDPVVGGLQVRERVCVRERVQPHAALLLAV